MTHVDTLLDPALPAQFLSLWPNYAASPVLHRNLGHLSVQIKDETNRMGLGSFKALGGGYAVARLIADDGTVPTLPECRDRARNITFICASAGNHGLSVAAAARHFGARARIHLAKTVPESFAARLRSLGAEVLVSGAIYEDSIQAAILDADGGNGVHLADGSWPGYTEPPRLVMEGYTVIAEELRRSYEGNNQWPSHVFLQAGVGGLAAAMTFMIRKNWTVQPQIIVVEPDRAPCLKASVTAGHMCEVEGPVSNMGRLDCKVPSLLAYEVLKSKADAFVTITDAQAETACEQLFDQGLPTTPSGAAGWAALSVAQLPSDARPLVIVSEGYGK